jgi:hypothetical protein
MRIDRSEDGDEDPSHADADAGRTAEAGSLESTRSPESAEANVEQAEPRTRNEYADHVRPQDSDSPSDPLPTDQESHHSEDEQPGAASLEDEQSRGSSTEEQQTQDQPRVPNDSEGSDEQPPSLHDPLQQLGGLEETDNVTTDNEHEEEPDTVNSLPSEAAKRPELDPSTEPDNEHQPPEADVLNGPPRDEASTPESTDDRELEREEARVLSLRDDRADRMDAAKELDKETLPIDDDAGPLTDKEWTEHLTEVRLKLETAHARGLVTDQLYTIDPDRLRWTRERRQVHGEIVESIYEDAKNVPCEHSAIIAGGLGGAGKTTILKEQGGIDSSKYLTINPDDVKEEMARRGLIPQVEGLSPMEASDLVHEESSTIAKRLARRAYADGKNLIWDITMSSHESAEARINDLHRAGYAQVDGIFVDISVETSARRIEARHRQGHDEFRGGHGLGGRFVPVEVVMAQADSDWGSRNRKTFEGIKDRFDKWCRYDNSVDGRPATLVDSNLDTTQTQRLDKD